MKWPVRRNDLIFIDMFKRRNTRFQGVSSPDPSGSGVEESPGSGRRRKLLRAIRLAFSPFVVLGLFLVAFASLGFLYFQAYQQETEDQSAIETAQASLAARPASPDTLRSALTGWTAALDAADQMRIRPQFDSSLLSQILAVADSAGVVVVSAGLQSDDVTVIEDSEYLSTPIRLRANGTMDVIRDFIARLEDGAVEALEVQSSDVTIGLGGYSAVINVRVFSQPDAAEGGAE